MRWNDMSFTELSCREFVSALSSKSPVPGGGGASAYVGAIGSALGNMVGSLTVGKKKYADVEQDIISLMDRMTEVQNELLRMVDRDEEKAERALIMEAALKDACSVPLEIMELCCKAIELQKEFAEKGSSLVLSDAGVGAALCRAALVGASFNVFINTKSMTDTEYASNANKRANDLLEKYVPLADEVTKYVFDKLG
jgi:formiminotetrahydrofolate cyclodeaminase